MLRYGIVQKIVKSLLYTMVLRFAGVAVVGGVCVQEWLLWEACVCRSGCCGRRVCAGVAVVGGVCI